jgi:hypothetical protein
MNIGDIQHDRDTLFKAIINRQIVGNFFNEKLHKTN